MCFLNRARSPRGVAIAASANERVKKVVVNFMLGKIIRKRKYKINYKK